MVDSITKECPELLENFDTECPFCKGELKAYETASYTNMGTVGALCSKRNLYEIICNNCGKNNFDYWTSKKEDALRSLIYEWSIARILSKSVPKPTKVNFFRKVFHKIFKN